MTINFRNKEWTLVQEDPIQWMPEERNAIIFVFACHEPFYREALLVITDDPKHYYDLGVCETDAGTRDLYCMEIVTADTLGIDIASLTRTLEV